MTPPAPLGETLAQWKRRVDAAPQRLCITIVKATGFNSNIGGDFLWCACEVTRDDLGAKTPRVETKAVPNISNPVWNETHDLEPWYSGESLDFLIYDYDNEELCSTLQGQITLGGHEFHQKGFEGEVPISGIECATLFVRVVPAVQVLKPLQRGQRGARASLRGVRAIESSAKVATPHVLGEGGTGATRAAGNDETGGTGAPGTAKTCLSLGVGEATLQKAHGVSADATPPAFASSTGGQSVLRRGFVGGTLPQGEADPRDSAEYEDDNSRHDGITLSLCPSAAKFTSFGLEQPASGVYCAAAS